MKIWEASTARSQHNLSQGRVRRWLTAGKGGFQRKPVVPCPHCFATSNHHSSLSAPPGSAYWIKHFCLKCISSYLSLHLFWGRGLAVEVKRFHQNNPQTNNIPRRQSADYKSISMKTGLVASGLHTANPLHLIRQIPYCVSARAPRGTPSAVPGSTTASEEESSVQFPCWTNSLRLDTSAASPGLRARRAITCW